MDDINLIPSDVRQRRQRVARLRLWGGVCAILVVLVPGSAFFVQRHVSATTQRVEALRQNRTQLVQRLEQLKGLRERQRQLQDREHIIDALYTRAPLQQLFYDMAGRTDEQLWLMQIQVLKGLDPRHGHTAPPSQAQNTSFFSLGKATAPNKEAPTPGQQGPVVLTVQGYTASNQRLADFMSALAAVPYLSKVNLLVARRGLFQAQEAIEFTIEIRL